MTQPLWVASVLICTRADTAPHSFQIKLTGKLERRLDILTIQGNLAYKEHDFVRRDMKNNILLSGVFFTLIGVVFGFIENTFYQYIDEDGLLHESVFMPLGVIFAAIGLSLTCIFSAVKLVQFVRRKPREI